MANNQQRRAEAASNVAAIAARDVRSVIIRNVDGVLHEQASLDQWIRDPVAVMNRLAEISAEDALALHELVRFQGFNKDAFLTAWGRFGASPGDMIKVAFVAAVRGTNVDRLRDILMLPELGINNAPRLVRKLVQDAAIIKNPARRRTADGRNAITMARCVAVVPHVVSALMLRANVEKKDLSSECPAHLQFPAAAALPLRAATRDQHRAFVNSFSTKINAGRVQDAMQQQGIYDAAMSGGILPFRMPAWIGADLVNDITEDAHAHAIATPTARLAADAAFPAAEDEA